MKTIDFTQPGGFPLTQDQLNYLQSAYTETTLALAAMGGDSAVPFIVSGMEVSNPSTGNYSITSGWFMYNNVLVSCSSGSITGATGASGAFIVITNGAAPLVFNDGSTPNVIFEQTASLQVLPGSTPTDTTHFQLSTLRRFGVGFGVANREANWNSMAVSTLVVDGGVTGTVYYKKDFTANTLQIRGVLTAGNAQNFAASPGALFYIMGAFPVGYRPNNTAYFSAQVFGATSIKDDLGVIWLKQFNCGVSNVGQFYVNWLRPDIAIAGYALNFNAIIPLS